MTAQALAGTSAGSASNVGLLTRRITTGATKNLTAANLALAKPLHGASTSVTRGYPAPRTPSPGAGAEIVNQTRRAATGQLWPRRET
jgi:hypothetical protein